VRGDPARLQQIVWNLLANAVKFTPRGGQVELALTTGDGLAEITVSDNGRGIDPAFLPYIFDPFRQADSSTTRTHGGLGLGLAIVRHLAELHGGSVTAASDGIDRGSLFRVRLPLRKPVPLPH
jgi:signal transduction histidine kinase